MILFILKLDEKQRCIGEDTKIIVEQGRYFRNLPDCPDYMGAGADTKAEQLFHTDKYSAKYTKLLCSAVDCKKKRKSSCKNCMDHPHTDRSPARRPALSHVRRMEDAQPYDKEAEPL